MQPVIGNLDKLYLTFPVSVPVAALVEKLFLNLSISSFSKVSTGNSYYRKRISLFTNNSYMNTEGERLPADGNNCLVAIFTDPKNSEKKLHRNERNLVQINGLAFSDSALNGLRPADGTPSLDLQRLCNAIIELNGQITQIDICLDDHSGILDTEKLIFDYSRPSKYKRHIQSNLIKDQCGERTPPRPFGTGCYYGVRTGTQAVLYQKHFSPHQDIYTHENQLKHPINRFEIRFRKALAKKVGHQIIGSIAFMNMRFDEFEPASVTAIIADVISRYFNFILPTKSNKYKADLDPEWQLFIETGLSAVE